MRLIDMDALIQKVKEEEDERHLDKDTTAILQFLIEEYAEPVDAMPVIRCKDCEHYSAFHMDCYRLGNVHPHKDDYCSWAKKKEN